ncbi:MAG: hypothetical protein H0V07_08675 [Propionibacteriales bacterium]|nr:hypothetical protein [Propionibacteriales bacterium]
MTPRPGGSLDAKPPRIITSTETDFLVWCINGHADIHAAIPRADLVNALRWIADKLERETPPAPPTTGQFSEAPA